MRALAAPALGHLDPALLELLDETSGLLRGVFRTSNKATLAVSGTGMAGMEAVLGSLLEPGDRLVVCAAGFFGNRIAELAARMGVVGDEGREGVGRGLHARGGRGGRGRGEAEGGRDRPRRDLDGRAAADGRARRDRPPPRRAADRGLRDVARRRAASRSTAGASTPRTRARRSAWAARRGWRPSRSARARARRWRPARGRAHALVPRPRAARPLLERRPRLPPHDLVDARLRAARGAAARGRGGPRGPLRAAPARTPRCCGTGSRRWASTLHVDAAAPHPVAHHRARARRASTRPRCARALRDEYGIEIGAGLGPLKGKVWRIGLMGHGSQQAERDPAAGGARGPAAQALSVARAEPRRPSAPAPAGYSGTPLPKKLGIKPGSVVALLGAPAGFAKGTLGPLPEGATLRDDPRAPFDVGLLFVDSKAELARRFPAAQKAMGEPCALWLCWPKQASGVSDRPRRQPGPRVRPAGRPRRLQGRRDRRDLVRPLLRAETRELAPSRLA